MIRFAPAFALVMFAGAVSANPAMTADKTTMRAAPSSHARIVQQIPAHAQIDIDECGDQWCAAFWRDIDGWVRVEALRPTTHRLEDRRLVLMSLATLSRWGLFSGSDTLIKVIGED